MLLTVRSIEGLGSLRPLCAMAKQLGRIFVERFDAWRQLNPRMPAAVVDGNSRRWKARVGKGSYRDTHGIIVSVFGMEDGSPANWAEPEYELGSVVPDTGVFGDSTRDFERSREAGQCREDTASSLLTSEAVANADSARFSLNFNA